jgi:hypothetical protein
MRPLARLVLLAAVLAASAPPADAQLGRFLNRARAAVTGDSPAEAARPVDGSPLAAVDYGDMLDTRFYPQRGEFLFDSPGPEFVLFAPPGEVSGAFVVRDAGGDVIGRQQIGAVGETGSSAIGVLTINAAPRWEGALEDGGAYTYEIVLNRAVLGSIPFTVAVRDNGDPYDPVTSYVLDGPWRTHAYFDYEADRTDYQLFFNAWVSADDMPDHGVTEVSIRTDGQEVAWGHGYSDPTYGWSRVEYELFTPAARDTEFGRHRVNPVRWTIEDVTPGTYEIVVSSEAGPFRTFTIEGASGAFVDHPRSDLAYEPRARFLATRRMKGQNLNTAFRMVWIGPTE